MAEVLARRAEMRKRVGRGEWVGGDSDLVLSWGEGEVGGLCPRNILAGCSTCSVSLFCPSIHPDLIDKLPTRLLTSGFVKVELEVDRRAYTILACTTCVCTTLAAFTRIV